MNHRIIRVSAIWLNCDKHDVCVCRLTEQDALRFALSQDGLKYSQQGLGQLLLEVVLCVDGNGVLQHIDRVLKQHVEEPWSPLG